MDLARYFVVHGKDQWHVMLGGLRMASCETQGQAAAKAAAMANLMGKMGHDADVMVESGDHLSLFWTAGVDEYPLRAAR